MKPDPHCLSIIPTKRRNVLPLSLSYCIPDPNKPHALRAAYPAHWQADRSSVRLTRESRCEHCHTKAGDIVRDKNGKPIINIEGRPTRAVLQVAHLTHNPCNTSPDALAVVCATCHRAWDRTQQSAASAVTMAVQGNLIPDRLTDRLSWIEADTRARGILGLTPGSADLLALIALTENGPMNLRELAAGISARLPHIQGMQGEQAATEREWLAIAWTAAARLHMRVNPTDNLPIVDRVEGEMRMFSRLTCMTTEPDAHGRAPVTKFTGGRWRARARSYGQTN